jgi:hypothetical protein
MVSIFDLIDGDLITGGITSGARSDEAFQIARRIAGERGADVVVEDTELGEIYTVRQDGTRADAPVGW